MATAIERMQPGVARVFLQKRRLHCCCASVVFEPCPRSIAGLFACCCCVCVYSAPARRRLNSQSSSRGRRGGLAPGHGGRSRTQAQAVSCLVVSWSCRNLSRRISAFCSGVPVIHAMVDGLTVPTTAQPPRPVVTVTEGIPAQFLLSPMLHVEVMQEDLDHVEALLPVICCAWSRSNYMPSSGAHILRVWTCTQRPSTLTAHHCSQLQCYT